MNASQQAPRSDWGHRRSASEKANQEGARPERVSAIQHAGRQKYASSTPAVAVRRDHGPLARPAVLALALALALAGCDPAAPPVHDAEDAVAPLVVATRTNPRDGLAYAWVEPGTFAMGCVTKDTECRDDERPPRRVAVPKGFWMTTTETTVGAFQRFVADTRYETTAEQMGLGGVLTRSGWENREGANWRSQGFEQGPRHPVVLTSWNDANAFCRWTGGRLPTEAEWEYAARGGVDGVTFVWGQAPPPIVNGRRHANVADRSASGVSVPRFEAGYDDDAPYTAPGGSFAPNGFGLHDMAGNVLEWCADEAPPDQRAARGGAWNNPPELMRASRRSSFAPETALTILGFRCLLEGL